MKKIINYISIFVLCLTLVGCGTNKDSNTSQNTENTNKQKNSGDINKKYEKIRKDFIAIEKDLSVSNIEKVTGIKPDVIKDGVEKYGNLAYEYKFDYRYDFEAYITLSYSHNPKTIYDHDTTYAKLKCSNEVFKNNDLDLSNIVEAEFKEDIKRGIKVSAIDNMAGGKGFANEYEKAAKTGNIYPRSMVWADQKGNYIKSSLRGGDDVSLPDKTLSFATFILK